jgi:hypothetical protein
MAGARASTHWGESPRDRARESRDQGLGLGKQKCMDLDAGHPVPWGAGPHDATALNVSLPRSPGMRRQHPDARIVPMLLLQNAHTVAPRQIKTRGVLNPNCRTRPHNRTAHHDMRRHDSPQNPRERVVPSTVYLAAGHPTGAVLPYSPLPAGSEASARVSHKFGVESLPTGIRGSGLGFRMGGVGGLGVEGAVFWNQDLGFGVQSLGSGVEEAVLGMRGLGLKGAVARCTRSAHKRTQRETHRQYGP